MLIVVHASLKCVKQLPDKSLILRQLLDSCLFVPKVVVRDKEPEEDGRLDHGVELLVPAHLVQMIDQVIHPLVDIVIPLEPPAVRLVHTVLGIISGE